jgi:hypothetical protein
MTLSAACSKRGMLAEVWGLLAWGPATGAASARLQPDAKVSATSRMTCCPLRMLAACCTAAGAQQHCGLAGAAVIAVTVLSGTCHLHTLLQPESWRHTHALHCLHSFPREQACSCRLYGAITCASALADWTGLCVHCVTPAASSVCPCTTPLATTQLTSSSTMRKCQACSVAVS